MSRHECPVAGCRELLPTHILMCRPHWELVPVRLRREVYVAWRERQAGAPRGLVRHHVATECAVAAVEGREPDPDIVALEQGTGSAS